MEQHAIRVYGLAEDLPGYLRHAVDFIMTNLAESFLLDDIAAAAGVSKRTLHWAFRVNFGVAVMAFVRQHRLELANRQLCAADAEGTTVTSVATSCGFQHLSRFSSAYREYFGEYPSETLRRRSCDACNPTPDPLAESGRLSTSAQGACPVPARLIVSEMDRPRPIVRPTAASGAPSAAYPRARAAAQPQLRARSAP